MLDVTKALLMSGFHVIKRTYVDTGAFGDSSNASLLSSGSDLVVESGRGGGEGAFGWSMDSSPAGLVCDPPEILRTDRMVCRGFWDGSGAGRDVGEASGADRDCACCWAARRAKRGSTLGGSCVINKKRIKNKQKRLKNKHKE